MVLHGVYVLQARNNKQCLICVCLYTWFRFTCKLL